MKYALGTVLGTAVLSLLKSQGSKTKLKVAYKLKISFTLMETHEKELSLVNNNFSGLRDLTHFPFDTVLHRDADDEEVWTLIEQEEENWKRYWDEEMITKKLGYSLEQFEMNPIDFEYDGSNVLEFSIHFSKIFLDQQDIPTEEQVKCLLLPYVRAVADTYLEEDADDYFENGDYGTIQVTVREIVVDADTGEIYRPPVENSSKLRKL